MNKRYPENDFNCERLFGAQDGLNEDGICRALSYGFVCAMMDSTIGQRGHEDLEELRDRLNEMSRNKRMVDAIYDDTDFTGKNRDHEFGLYGRRFYAWLAVPDMERQETLMGHLTLFERRRTGYVLSFHYVKESGDESGHAFGLVLRPESEPSYFFDPNEAGVIGAAGDLLRYLNDYYIPKFLARRRFESYRLARVLQVG